MIVLEPVVVMSVVLSLIDWFVHMSDVVGINDDVMVVVAGLVLVLELVLVEVVVAVVVVVVVGLVLLVVELEVVVGVTNSKTLMEQIST